MAATWSHRRVTPIRILISCSKPARSKDRLRQHSWGVDDEGATVETKWPGEKYFGVTLAPGVPTVLFVLNNYDGDIKEVLRAGAGRAGEIIRVLRAARGDNGAVSP
jgi:hypothetical protein